MYKQLATFQRSLLLVFSGLISPTDTASDPRKIEFSSVHILISPVEMMRRESWSFTAKLHTKNQACNTFHPGGLMSGL